MINLSEEIDFYISKWFFILPAVKQILNSFNTCCSACLNLCFLVQSSFVGPGSFYLSGNFSCCCCCLVSQNGGLHCCPLVVLVFCLSILLVVYCVLSCINLPHVLKRTYNTLVICEEELFALKYLYSFPQQYLISRSQG